MVKTARDRRAACERDRERLNAYVTRAAYLWVFSTVLLVVFVLISSGFHYRIPVGVDLPRVWNGRSLKNAARESSIQIMVTRQGRIYCGSVEIERQADLIEQVRTQIAAGAEHRAYIQIDARARYRSVKDVLNAIRAAEVEHVTFYVENLRPD